MNAVFGSRVAAKPFAVGEFGDVSCLFVLDRDDLGPSRSLVNHREAEYLHDEGFGFNDVLPVFDLFFVSTFACIFHGPHKLTVQT